MKGQNMNSVVQAVLKENPGIQINIDIAHKFYDAMNLLVEELNRQGEAKGQDRIDEDTIVSRIEDVADREFAMWVEEQISSVRTLDTEAAFALGWYSRGHPEWFIFADPDDTDKEPTM